MLDRALPADPGLAFAEDRDDVDADLWLDAERALAGTWAPRRQREFHTVRHLARTALRELGVDPVPILRAESGAPLWPAGVVGSMTHCSGYRGALVADPRVWRSVGIDAEPAEPLPDRVLEVVSSAAERDALPAGEFPADRLLFCAKEAVYKAWFPLTGRWLGFTDVTLDLHTDGSFSVRLHEPTTLDDGTALSGFEGRWAVVDGIALTAICVRA